MSASIFATDATARWRFYPNGFSFNPLKPGLSRSPSIKIDLTVRNWHLKTAETAAERKAAYRLRYEVFNAEFGERYNPTGLDRDRFDDVADLLIVKEIATGKVIGTYRMICSEFSDRFYSATEFGIKEFLKTPGIKVELSRAAVHVEHRSGVILSLLWRGVLEYLARAEAKYLFGMSSVAGVTPLEVLAVMQHLKTGGHLDDRYGILPTPKYDQSAKILCAFNNPELAEINPKELLPSLLRGYLNGGARVCSVPAYDPEFRCFDFFTILDCAELNAAHSRKFGSQLAQNEKV